MGTWPACLTCRYEGSRVSEQLRVVSTFLFNVVPQGYLQSLQIYRPTYGDIPEPACGRHEALACQPIGWVSLLSLDRRVDIIKRHRGIVGP